MLVYLQIFFGYTSNQETCERIVSITLWQYFIIIFMGLCQQLAQKFREKKYKKWAYDNFVAENYKQKNTIINYMAYLL